MNHRPTLSDRLLLRLWNTRAVRRLTVQIALAVRGIVGRMTGSSRVVLTHDFQSPPLLDMLDRFVHERQAGLQPGTPPDQPSTPSAPAPESPPDDPA